MGAGLEYDVTFNDRRYVFEAKTSSDLNQGGTMPMKSVPALVIISQEDGFPRAQFYVEESGRWNIIDGMT